jgi:hypothetical protein
MSDAFKDHIQGLESPATRLAAVVPNDGQDLSFATRAIAVETSGFVELVTTQGDTGRVYIAAGVPFPLRAIRIRATGTTATGIVALA